MLFLKRGERMTDEMSGKAYKKTYKGLCIWMILFVLAGSTISIILSGFVADGKLLTNVTLLVVVAFLDLLMFIIYKGEYIYWINGGPDYEKARKATSEQRKAYAWKHLKAFLIASVIFLLYLGISFARRFSIWVDILIFAAVVIAAAISTIFVKMDETI